MQRSRRRVETNGGRAKGRRREHTPNLWGPLRDVNLDDFYLMSGETTRVHCNAAGPLTFPMPLKTWPIQGATRSPERARDGI